MNLKESYNFGFWFLVPGLWLLAFWLLASGFWLTASASIDSEGLDFVVDGAGTEGVEAAREEGS